MESGNPVLREDMVLGDDEERRKDLEFAAAMHDFQNGPFNQYFAHGRTGRLPEAYALNQEDGRWRIMDIYDLRPSVGVLQLDGEGTRVWVFGNGWESDIRLRLKAGSSEMLVSTLAKPPEIVNFKGGKFVEVRLSPLEIGAIEWKFGESLGCL